MKRVSFKVAKALKEAGYPQPLKDEMGYYSSPCNFYFTGRHSYYNEYRERRLDWDETNELHTIEDWATEIEPHFYGDAVAAPTYLEVWLWLWREKKTIISCQPWHDGLNMWGSIIETSSCYDEMYEYDDPEDALIAAIEHLVDNNLIK